MTNPTSVAPDTGADATAPEATSFWDTAERAPHRPAVVVDGGESVTFGELATRIRSLARGLVAHGIRTGDRIAVILTNRVEYVLVQVAAHTIGATMVPVNRHLTAPELHHILADCNPALVVVDEHTAPSAVPAAVDAAIDRARLVAAGAVDGVRPISELAGADGPLPERPAGTLLFYSSGTTGKPKGIVRPVSGLSPVADQRRIAAAARSISMGPGGVFLSVGPLYHAAPNQNMLMGLVLGKTVVVSSGFDPDHVLSLIERHRVTDTFLVPTMLHRLLSLPAERRATADVSSLRCVLHAGAICPVATKRAMIEWVGPVLMEYYGASESGAATTITSEQWLEHPGSVGQARPGMSVRVCDETGAPLSAGEVGLIHIRTGVTVEYLGDPHKTAHSYVDGYFVPGDMGYLDEDGWLYLCDRRTDMIISGGVNIYPAEVEAALLEHPDVVDVAVFGVSNDEWGQSVVALVELAEDAAPEPEAVERLLDHCAGRLARFKIPRVLRVVDTLPRTAAGKINKAHLRAAFEKAAG
ncbi:AMP-binding protein [Rhodococcus indonesiensis]|uniref:AMP-binding protein n=1 Tax=Rhodococcus indonesiensis TaxID=3055869 RepID=UPI0039F69603